MVAVREAEAHAAVVALQNPLAAHYLTGEGWRSEPPPPPPAVAMRLDEGGAVLRENRTYLLTGEAGLGKSLLLLGAAVEVANAGRAAVFLDWEDSRRTALVRVRALRIGVTERALSDDGAARLFYACTVGETALPPLPEDCALVVVDSVSRVMGAMGLDENSASDFLRFVTGIVEPLREAAPDAALVLIDHPGHADPKRARGTSAKRPVVDVELTLTVGGTHRRLVLRKDRHADYTVPVGGTVADVFVHRGDETSALHYRQSVATFTDDGALRMTGLMEKVSRYLERQAAPVSKRSVVEHVTGRERYLSHAVQTLAAEGYVEATPGPNRAQLLVSRMPYREATDRKVDAQVPPETLEAPPSSRAGGTP
jgi:hypothetical protein